MSMDNQETLPVEKKKRGCNPITSLILIILFVVLLTQVGFYTIQPLAAVPNGGTVLIWRHRGEPFFNSADGECLKIQDGVSLLCRAARLSVAPVDRIILRLPYIHAFYLFSTGGREFVQ